MIHPSAFRYYQLTHDYLVPSLREWLTRKQRETRRGRAELKLSERSALWNAKPENRHLPSLTEWLSIRTRTESKYWTAPQRAMMKRAGGFHLFRSTTVLVILGLAAMAGFWTWNRVDQNRRELLVEKAKEQETTRIEGLVGRLKSAEPAQVPEIVKELDSNQAIAATYLSPLVTFDAKTIDENRAQLHARLATVAGDKTLVEPLLEELLTNKGPYIGPIREQLRQYAAELTEKLWAILRDDKAEAKRRFRAAVALADYIPASKAASWTEQDLQFVAGQLVVENAEFQPLLRENLRPISGRLLPDLEKIFGHATSPDAQRSSAANAFADYAASDIPKLFELLTVATPAQYAVLYPLVAATPAPLTPISAGDLLMTKLPFRNTKPLQITCFCPQKCHEQILVKPAFYEFQNLPPLSLKTVSSCFLQSEPGFCLWRRPNLKYIIIASGGNLLMTISQGGKHEQERLHRLLFESRASHSPTI